jgi:hypothetical protein
MATTTNFGWDTPDDTDLVKDGAAAIRTALNGVDTSFVDLKGGTTGQVLSKTSGTDLDFTWITDATGMTNPMTTTGDTIYSSSGSTPARLAVGSTGDVLTVAGGVPTWAAPSGGTSWVLLNAGGTALTSASTITISSINGYEKYMIFLKDCSTTTINDTVYLRINTDSGSNYSQFGAYQRPDTAYAATLFSGISEVGVGQIEVAQMNSSGTTARAHSTILIDGGKNTGIKGVQVLTGTNPLGGGYGSKNYQTGGIYSSSAVLSSISLVATNNFDLGTVYVYGSL